MFNRYNVRKKQPQSILAFISSINILEKDVLTKDFIHKEFNIIFDKMMLCYG